MISKEVRDEGICKVIVRATRLPGAAALDRAEVVVVACERPVPASTRGVGNAAAAGAARQPDATAQHTETVLAGDAAGLSEFKARFPVRGVSRVGAACPPWSTAFCKHLAMSLDASFLIESIRERTANPAAQGYY